MSAWSSVRSWLGGGAGRRGEATGPRRAAPTFRPMLEELERREAPSSLLGLTTADQGLSAPSWSSGDPALSGDPFAALTGTNGSSASSTPDALTLAGAKKTPTDPTASSQSPAATPAPAGVGSANDSSLAGQATADPFAATANTAAANAAALAPQARGGAVAGAPPGLIPPQLMPLAQPAYASQSIGANVAGAPVFTPSLIPPPTIPLSNASWSLIGPAPVANGQVPGVNPVSGRVAGIAPDPTNANIIYLATAGGGVWKTTDGGGSWTPLTDNQPTLFMGAIAVAPTNPNIIYAGTGESTNALDSYYGLGVLVSTDAGATWTLQNNGGAFTRKTFSKIVVDPTNANIVYGAVANGGSNGVGGNDGIWKSVDGGVTWTNTTVAIPGVTGNSVFSDLVINSTTPSQLFCAVGNPGGAAENGVYVTNNGGATWAAAGNFPGGAADGNIKIDISRSNPLTLYASASDPATQGILFVDKSVDGGVTWTNTTMPPNYLGTQGFYDSTVAVDPTNANTVFLGGQIDNTGHNGVLESTDGGATWNDITIGVSGADGPHADHHAAAFDASGNYLDGDDGGIWRLQNPTPGAIVWTDLNSNLSTLQAEGIALNPTTPNIAYMGTQDNGTDEYTGALAWQQDRGGDGGFVRVDPNNPMIVYHTFFRVMGSVSFIERSNDGGVTWTDISTGVNPTDNSDFYPPYQIDQSNPNRLILGTDHVYETLDQGATWSIIGTPGTAGLTTTGSIAAIGLSQSAPNTIYVADDAGNVFVTNNDGTSWTQINLPGAAQSVNQLVVDPTNSNSVYAVRDIFGPGKVFHSTDGGASWTDISGNLPDLPTYALALDPTNNILYAGNDNGVFASNNGGASWSVFGTGLPNAQVRELEYNASLGILAAGTHGRSMWEISTVAGGGGGGGGGGGSGGGKGGNETEPEPNQTSDTATNFGALSVGQTESTGESIGVLPDARNDYDWFRWSAAQAGTFTATETTTSGGNLELHLFTLQGNTLVELAQSTAVGVASQSLSVSLAANQVIFAEIKGQNDFYGDMTGGLYTLGVTLT